MSEGLNSWTSSVDSIGNKIPLGRLGNENDMIGASMYFASRAGSWCTGVIMNVDGGTIEVSFISFLWGIVIFHLIGKFCSKKITTTNGDSR